jgi:hypothetical protein
MNRFRSLVGIGAVAALALAAGWASGCGAGDVEQRLAAKPGGSVSVDIELGSGISFDHGSLSVSTHERDEVQVVADVSGWGGYAVEIDIEQHPDEIEIVGRVDGALHWMFGGPTVDVQVIVPADSPIEARINGGDLELEDLGGLTRASVQDGDIRLIRADGDVHLASDGGGGSIRAEDVEGSLRVESDDGEVVARGIHGSVFARTDHGEMRLSSIDGPLDVASERGAILLKRVRGNTHASSGRGRIEIEDLVGALDVSTQRGRIEVSSLRGPIRARSDRGGIHVGFADAPSGSVHTGRGSIHVQVPALGGFALEADTRRGEVQIAQELRFEAEVPAVAASGVNAAEQVRALQELGERVADEVRNRVEARVEYARKQWEQRRNSDRGWSPHEDWENWKSADQPWPWESADWRWPDADWTGPLEEGARQWGRQRDRGDARVGAVNGGGDPLKLRSDRGSIHIDSR